MALGHVGSGRIYDQVEVELGPHVSEPALDILKCLLNNQSLSRRRICRGGGEEGVEEQVGGEQQAGSHSWEGRN